MRRARTVPLQKKPRLAVPPAPAWLQRAGLGADVIGTGATQRGSEGGGCLMLTTLLRAVGEHWYDVSVVGRQHCTHDRGSLRASPSGCPNLEQISIHSLGTQFLRSRLRLE